MRCAHTYVHYVLEPTQLHVQLSLVPTTPLVVRSRVLRVVVPEKARIDRMSVVMKIMPI